MKTITKFLGVNLENSCYRAVAGWFVVAFLLAAASQAAAQTSQGSAASPKPARPDINWFRRWQEDWSVLADPALRTDPFDSLKYIPIGSNSKSYLSLGLTVRGRFESVSVGLSPVLERDNYLFDRVQLHADLHLGSHVRVFTQFVDARSPGKSRVGPTDQNKLDLEQAFIEVTVPAGKGSLKFTAGRQEPQLDLQRFVDIRDGPNVRQPFDAVTVEYTRKNWGALLFFGRPVDTRDRRLFDDVSSKRFTITGARIERRNVGAGKLSVFVAQLRNDNAFYLTALGAERRNVIDMRYAGRVSGWDWDLEGMAQGGHVGAKKIRAWGMGGLFGYTWASRPWSPRLGFQADAASGNRDPNGKVLGTFNPLFPSGYYETLSGYPGYANFVHLRSSVMVNPTKTLSALFDVGALWRVTTADAVYLLPAIPVTGTAGRGNSYSGAYAQGRLNWRISPHLNGAINLEQFAHSQWLKQTGGRNGHYIGVELSFGI